jgi:hypothetical protein
VAEAKAQYGSVGTAAGYLPVGTTTVPASMLGVYGGVTIGSSYISTTAPSNGAIIQGNVGIGTTGPSQALEVNGNIALSATANQTIAVRGIVGGSGNGYNLTIAAGAGDPGQNDNGGNLNLNAGASANAGIGGSVNINAGSGGYTNTVGGSITLTSGTGGTNSGRYSGNINLIGANIAGNYANDYPGSLIFTAGSATGSGAAPGGSITMTSGAAGPSAIGGAITLTSGQGGSSGSTNGSGGLFTIQGGAPGSGIGTAGAYGAVVLQASGGNVGIGTTAPVAGEEIQIGSAASTPGVKLSGNWYTGGTATTTKPQLLVEPAGTASTGWNTSGTGIGVNAASGFSGYLLDLQIGGSRQFGVSGSTVSVNNVTGVAQTTNTIHLGTQYEYMGFSVGSNGGWDNASLRSNYAGATPAFSLSADYAFAFTNQSGRADGTQDTFIIRQGAANLHLGAWDAAAPVAQTLGVQNVVGGTSNTAGANFTITGSQGTGTGAGGAIVFQTAPAGSTGSTQNALATAMTIASTGYVGIGTTSPGEKLDIAGNSTLWSTIAGIRLDDTSERQGKPMARQKPSDQVATLQKQQAELAKKLKEAQTKARNEAKETERQKNELAGAVALRELQANPSGAFADALLGMLKHHLTRAADRELFGLPPLPKGHKPAPQPAVKPFLMAAGGTMDGGGG